MSVTGIIIDQTHHEKSNWPRAFNQFTIACELDMINAISAAVKDFSILMYTFNIQTKVLLLCFKIFK